jgi:serine/threonine protein kinase
MDWANEIQVLRDFQHPNIQRLYRIIRTPPGIVTEFIERGSLLKDLEDTSNDFD